MYARWAALVPALTLGYNGHAVEDYRGRAQECLGSGENTMKLSLMGLIGLLGVAALPVEAFAQEQTGRARNQSLQEPLKPRDVFTTQSVPTAETPKRPGSNDGASDLKKKPRPTIIEGPGYNKGLSAPPR
jgi:hypothetical protein